MVSKADGGVARTAEVSSVTAAPPSAADGTSDSDLPGNYPRVSRPRGELATAKSNAKRSADSKRAADEHKALR